MRRRVDRVCVAHAIALVLAGGLAACGPVTYVGDVRRASAAVDEARAAQAEKYAPYWWTRAVEYLHKAREIAAHADFQGAHRFGQLAAAAAAQATADARIAARDPAKRPKNLAPDVAPARPTEAPVAPARDLPVPAKDRTAPPRPPAPRVAPAKDPP